MSTISKNRYMLSQLPVPQNLTFHKTAEEENEE
jgi:hypothetical protein